MCVPDWLTAFLVGGSAGGLAGYLLRAWIDDQFTRQKEKRAERRADLKAQHDALLQFLGQPRQAFIDLEIMASSRKMGPEGLAAAKLENVAGWAYANGPRFPPALRQHLAIIRNTAYQFAVGDRHFLETPHGSATIDAAWKAIEKYADTIHAELVE
jgi:hypothetical protein